MKSKLHQQLRLSDLGSGPIRNTLLLRCYLFHYYLRKSGRSLDTWTKNVQNYPHPRRFNLIFRSFIKNRVGIPLIVNEEFVPINIRDYVFKYYLLAKTDYVYDKESF